MRKLPSPAMEEETPQNPNKPSEDEHSIAQKHEAMIAHLTDLHQSRLQQRESNSNSNPSPSFESTNSFLHHFSTSKQSIESSLDTCHTLTANPPQLKSHLENISLSITDLEKFVAENSYFLPNYEVRSSLKTISDLKEKLEIANSEFLPKKKFSFKNKTKTKDLTTTTNNNYNNVDAKGEDIRGNIVIRDSPGFRDKQGAVLIKNFGEMEVGEFILSNLDSCEVHIVGRLRGMFMHKLKNCRVYVGPVMGSVHIEEAEGCLFMLASQQIRIHYVKKSDFYLRVRSRPIIEDTNGVRFAPYLLEYEGIENDLKACSLDDDTGNWGNVDDFRWLRAVQSPNWCVLPEEERVAKVKLRIDETTSENS